MRPLDPQVLPHLLPARRPLALVVGTGVTGGVLTIAQAWSIGTLVVRLVGDPAGSAWHETDPVYAQALLDAGRATRLAT